MFGGAEDEVAANEPEEKMNNRSRAASTASLVTPKIQDGIPSYKGATEQSQNKTEEMAKSKEEDKENIRPGQNSAGR